jgi:hypothetical protein
MGQGKDWVEVHDIKFYKALNLCFLDRKKLSLSCVFNFWLCVRTSSQLELKKDELVNVILMSR